MPKYLVNIVLLVIIVGSLVALTIINFRKYLDVIFTWTCIVIGIIVFWTLAILIAIAIVQVFT